MRPAKDPVQTRRWLTRRHLLKGAGLGMLPVGAGGTHAVAIEPFRERVASYAITPPGWPSGFKLRVAALADLHVVDPWTSLARLERIVETTNALAPDVIVLLGDYVPGKRIESMGTPIAPQAWGPVLGRLKAPGGVHAVLGNHDWWEDPVAQRTRKGPTEAHRALSDNGIAVHENAAIRLSKSVSKAETQPYWIAGLGDQWAFFGGPRFSRDGSRNSGRYIGVDDLDATVRAVADDAPAILLIHEPDVFPRVPNRFALTLAGHTHGGQIRFFGYAPIVPSRFRNRYVHGHIIEDGRHLIVSAGLGVSGLPVRFASPSEIVVVDLG